MSDALSLAKRVFHGHRTVVLVLAVLLLLNILAYAFFVYPLAQRVSTVAERTQAAEAELAAARLMHTRAIATLTGKARATEALETFYGSVLPADFAGARDVAFSRLGQLARQANLRMVGTRIVPAEPDADGTVASLRINMDLAGTYASVRRFLDALERMPEFLVIDQLALSETRGDQTGLNVRMELSTYYRDTAYRDTAHE